MNIQNLTPEEIIALYNPTNAKALTDVQIQDMQNLPDEIIALLAKAYPNQSRNNNYLVLINKNLAMNKQVYQLSTWPNLKSLRSLNKKEFVAFTFHSLFMNTVTPGVKAPVTAAKKQAVIVDLTNDELNGVEGLKAATPLTEGFMQEEVIEIEAATETTEQAVIVSPELQAAIDELQQAIDEKAHHMTIKSLQAKVDALKESSL